MKSILKLRILWLTALLLWIPDTDLLVGQTHRLNSRGRTHIEGEHYANVSSKYPKVETKPICSGKQTLAFFWGSYWFEMNLDVPEMCTFELSLSTASMAGTQIEVHAASPSGQLLLLAVVEVPKTGDWNRFTQTRKVTLSLPAGRQTLRFFNRAEGANVDYLTFAAKPGNVVELRPKVVADPAPDAAAILPVVANQLRYLWPAHTDKTSLLVELDLEHRDPKSDTIYMVQLAAIDMKSEQVLTQVELAQGIRFNANNRQTIAGHLNLDPDPRRSIQLAARLIVGGKTHLLSGPNAIRGEWSLLGNASWKTPVPKSRGDGILGQGILFPFRPEFRTQGRAKPALEKEK